MALIDHDHLKTKEFNKAGRISIRPAFCMHIVISSIISEEISVCISPSRIQ